MTPGREGPPADDVAAVASLLGREPAGDFRVVVRRDDGSPAVIENAPFLRDGTPMPTRFWLVDGALRDAVARLEAEGGVRHAESAVDPEALVAAHARYQRERDALVPPGHAGPRPSGGVGGTRTGVKCLHAHFAWWLAGGDDPVGSWVAARLGLEHASDAARDRGRLPAAALPAAALAGAGIAGAGKDDRAGMVRGKGEERDAQV